MKYELKKVERKQHRDVKPRRLVWLAAAFLLLACSVTAAVLLSRRTEEIIPREDHTGMLADRRTEELVSVTVDRRNEDAWTLVRTENGSLMPEDGSEWTVTEQQADRLQEAVTKLRYEEILTEDPADWAETPEAFGLAEPLVTVTARYMDGTSLTVRIGNDVGLEEAWHYMAAEGDGRLYAVSAGIVEDLDIEYALLHPVPRPEIYAALLDRITVTDADGSIAAEWILQGQITDRDAGSNWILTVPYRCPADEESVQKLKKSAENLRLGAYTAPATEEELDKTGLTIPRRTVAFHMAAGSTGTVGESGVYDITDHGESTVTLQIGSQPDEMAVYVRFGEEIFTVSHFTLSAFSDPDPLGTAARYPVLTPLLSLESLTVEEAGKVLQYALKEKEKTEEEAETEYECRLNGEEISYEAFAAAYERLLTVTYSGMLPKDAVWQDPYKKYTFRTLSGGTHTVTLSEWDGVHDAVTVDGSTIFYLIKGGMTDLPGPGQ